LDGLHVVLASQAGPAAVRALRHRNIHLFAISGSIDRALRSLARRGRILLNIPYRSADGGNHTSCGGCGSGATARDGAPGCGVEPGCGSTATQLEGRDPRGCD
jgi:hypothetical protein